MKLHLGCGSNIKEGYTNIDKFVKGKDISNFDILNLPYDNESVEEIITEHLIEHLPFCDEEKFFKECYRLLSKGGLLICETPDMEWLCEQFIKAEDKFTEFYKVGAVDHYFGNKKSIEHRWGMITTHFFGNQNGEGQFHCNAYTASKMKQIGQLIGFSKIEVVKICNKGAHCIVGYFYK